MAKWGKIKDRGNVEDRRGMSGGAAGGIGVVGILAVLAVGYFGSPDQAIQLLGEMQEKQPTISQEQTQEFEGEDSYEVFASTVLGSNNTLWKELFTNSGTEYQAPRLVLFRNATQSACGGATSKVGPHYCPTDETIYLDETFFDELTKKFGAKGGDVAEAYVIAHEVAHHIQNKTGFMQKVHSIRKSGTTKQANAASVKLELQADCLAGIWARTVASKGVLEIGEISEAIDAAEAVGDDRIQEAAYGETHPETWTHGSSAQRKQWFQTGYDSGSFDTCNTFK